MFDKGKLKAMQFELTRNIRSGNGELSNIESRRLNIYKELFFNNIDGFCSTTFPITKQILGDDAWQQLVRNFFIEHQSETPHFIEISQEFLSYLITHQTDYKHLPFLAELAHYEWVELDLAVKDFEFKQSNVNSTCADELITLYVSSGCMALSYTYPVHTISVENHSTISAEPTSLFVYRNIDFEVKFVRVDQLTVIMFQFIQQNSGINKVALRDQLMSLNETFTKAKIENFINASLSKFCELSIITTS